jgi:hypothetical protein
MRWTKLLLGVLMIGGCFGASATGAAPLELPLTRVVLFSSGVASFEHAGTVSGDANVRMFFKTGQMNDVLKSMVVSDLDGGQVAGIGYASQDPLLRALKGFSVDISDNPSLADLLERLRGAEIILHAPERIAGKILNVEKHTKMGLCEGEPMVFDTYTLNLLTEAGLQPVEMESITLIRLADATLDNEMRKAVDLLAQSMDTDKKALDIVFRGEGERRVRVAYILEAPVWKTSYRLDLREGDALIQGWGIVENTSDSDWQAVRLDLVSGRPVSFIQDLYSPLYVKRPLVKPEVQGRIKPPRYEKGFAPALPAPGGQATEKDQARMVTTAAAPPGVESLEDQISMDTGVSAVARGEAAGELFHFSIREPVDLMRRQSAMLPILNDTIAVEKISIYNATTSDLHPMNGAKLTNTTGLKLPPGPITVFDGGTYAGDGRFDTLVPQAKTLIGYAVDLEVAVDATAKQDRRRTVVKIVNGTLWERETHRFEQTYLMDNKSADPRQLIVEHPYRPDRTLVAPESFEEKTPRHYRFRRELRSGQQDTFAVIEERVLDQQVVLGDLAVERLLWYAQTDGISPEVTTALRCAARLKEEIVTLKRRLAMQQEQISTVSADQRRVRENLESAGKQTLLGKRYLQKLSQQEDLIEELQARVTTLRKEVAAKQLEFDDYVNKLTIE